MNHGIIPYVGGKHRLAHRLVDRCAGTGADTFVDVFGGSAALTLAAVGRFGKVIYNDLDGDLVNLFRVISDPKSRQELFRLLRWLPPSRQIYDDDNSRYLAGGRSFCRIEDPVERARCVFYRHAFAFGGKTRSGGFAISTGDPCRIKEVARYRNMLRKLARIGETFRKVIIENLHYSELIRIHGRRSDACLFLDPPYFGTEGYYSRTFGPGDHAFLAEQATTAKAHAVCTYYDDPGLRRLYSSDQWNWESIAATKNSALTKGNKVITNEFVITKKSNAEVSGGTPGPTNG